MKTTLREGSGWNSGLPVESNFVVECDCGFTNHIATTSLQFAERCKDNHVRDHFRKLYLFMAPVKEMR